MKYMDLIENILESNLDGSNAGVLMTSTTPVHECTIAFGAYKVVIPPMEELTYFYEIRPIGYAPSISIPNAILLTPPGADQKVIFLYELEN